MKRALMISYVFLPMGGVGVQRSLYYAKYLSEFAYRPLVVHGTVRPPLPPKMPWAVLRRATDRED